MFSKACLSQYLGLLQEIKSCYANKTSKMTCVPSEDSDQPGHQSSLSAWNSFGSLATHKVPSKDCAQTAWMPRLIWVFVGRTGNFVGFVLLWLQCIFQVICDLTRVWWLRLGWHNILLWLLLVPVGWLLIMEWRALCWRAHTSPTANKTRPLAHFLYLSELKTKVTKSELANH